MAWFLSRSQPFVARRTAGKAATEPGLWASKRAHGRLMEVQEKPGCCGTAAGSAGQAAQGTALAVMPNSWCQPTALPQALGSADP